MHRKGSLSKKRRQNDRYEENYILKKRRKGKPERRNMQPLGEIARHEEQR
jgi:hypothetical protein